MAFKARIELVGLFRFWPETEGVRVKRICGLAPWTGEGVEPFAVQPVKLHHFVAMWWPRSERAGVPPSAMTLWPLGGMELTFDFETRQSFELDVDLDGLQLPVMTREGEPSGSEPRAIVPPTLHEMARLDTETYIDQRAGDFFPDMSPAARYTDHLGIQKNTANLMGRVVIDGGTVETDDLTSLPSSLKPSLWGEQRYTGDFTNRLAVIVPRVRAVTMRARNLITGNLAGEVRLETADRELLVQILHLCPAQLLTDCPDSLEAEGSRDEDFRALYGLSKQARDLEEEMHRRNRMATVPEGHYDGHTCRRVRCGSCVS